jgi:hypothetical protein
MVSNQMTTVLALLDREAFAARSARPPETAAVQAAVALGVDGITAGVGTGPEGLTLGWGTETVSVGLENQQFTLGEGPGIDAAHTGVPVLVPDLAAAATRWPGFAPAAADLGVRAVFAFPLRIGVISVGTLLAQRTTPGPLVNGQLTDALALADAVATVLLHRQSAEADRVDQPPPGWAQPVTYRAEVHQATGMISVQLGVSLAEALVRLRAYAWSGDHLIADVAADVVARRLSFANPNL